MAHWYLPSGETLYKITGANGKQRDTSLRDARKLDLAVGVTSILKVAASDNLTNWIVDQTIEACRLDPFCEMGCTPEDWAARIKEKRKAEGTRVTDRGAKIHDAMETYYKSGGYHGDLIDYVEPIAGLLATEFDEPWVAEQSFNYKGLYGGKVDLHSRKGAGVVIDFKTKDSDDVSKYKGYDTQIMQLAAYREGLGIPNSRIGNVFVSANTPGIVTLEMYTEEQAQKAWEMFKCLLRYWHLERGFKEVTI